MNFMFSAKELDRETGFYYYGARYLDPKYSRWISADPAMNTGEYFPVAPVDDEAKKHNGNLPGMGGVFNHINANLYHYAGNNPVKYTDPDGRNALGKLIDVIFSPFTSFMLEPQDLGGSSKNYSNRSYYNQTFKSAVDQDNGWRSFFGMLGWAPGKVGIASTLITWICPEKEPTNEIDYYERLQFIAGAKKEIERLKSMKESCKNLRVDNGTGQSFLEFLDVQIDKLNAEIEINEKLDEKELKQKKAEYYYYGGAVAGPFRDDRNKEAPKNNNLVNYLDAYMEEGKRDY